eukprot:SAG22_NODE_5246_length_1054_cov_0.832461_1_plen_320_part_10
MRMSMSASTARGRRRAMLAFALACWLPAAAGDRWAAEPVPDWLAEQLAGARAGTEVELGGGSMASAALATAAWPALNGSWADKPRFLRAHGPSHQLARWPTGGRQVGVLARPVTVRSFVATMPSPDSGLLFDGSTAGLAGGEWAIPELVAAAGAADPLISIGPSGRGLPFHNHQAAWEAVVVGAKLFVLFEPTATSLPGWLLLRPLSELLRRPDGPLSRALASGRLPAEAGGHAVQWALLWPGDSIYVPDDYWHATLNIGDTVAVGASGSDGKPAAADAGATADGYAEAERALRSVAPAELAGDYGKSEDLLVRAAKLAP